MVEVIEIPYEIWEGILKYTSLYTISQMQVVSTFFRDTIYNNRYRFIDVLHNNSEILIPKNRETYQHYKYCISWRSIIMNNRKLNKKIPENVIEWITDSSDLNVIAVYQTFSESFLKKYFTKFSWKVLVFNQKLPLDILVNIIETDILFSLTLTENDTYSLWNKIWSNENITFSFLEKYIHYVQWHPVSCNKSLVSFELIDKYADNLVWQEFTKHSINEHILTHYVHHFDFICWSNIAEYTKLSYEFIITHFAHLHLNLNTILRFQKIPEWLLIDWIEEYGVEYFSDWMYFESVCLNQKMSKTFIETYKEYLPLKNLIRNKHVSRTTLQEIFD